MSENKANEKPAPKKAKAKKKTAKKKETFEREKEGQIYTKFKNIYIQSAAGDAGGALGSAFIAHYSNSKKKEKFFMSHSYWGNEFSNDYIKNLCEQNYKLFENDLIIHIIIIISYLPL